MRRCERRPLVLLRLHSQLERTETPTSCPTCPSDPSAGRCHVIDRDCTAALAGGPLDQAMQTMKRIHEEFFRLEDAGRRPTTKDIIR